MSTVATRQTGALAIQDDATSFTTAQLEAFGIADANRGEQMVFLHTAQRTGLDPAARQIYMIGRWDGRSQRNKFTIQTGIDGYRLIARRAADRRGEAMSNGDAQWCGTDGVWHDVWLSDSPPAAARALVYRNGEPFSAVALYREYVQTNRQGEPNQMWSQRPAGQLEKCAEALALRKAFPQELSGVYTDDEMGQADNPPDSARVARPRYAQIKRAQDDVVEGEVIEPVAADQTAEILALMDDREMPARDRLAFVADAIGRSTDDPSDLTGAEADQVIQRLKADADVPGDQTADGLPPADQDPTLDQAYTGGAK